MAENLMGQYYLRGECLKDSNDTCKLYVYMEWVTL